MYLIFGPALQLFPGVFRQLFQDFVEVRHGVDAEDEPYAVVIPGVEFLALRKVGVAPQEDLPKARRTATGNRPIEVARRLFMAGTVARAVDHIQRLTGIGQGEN